MSGGICTTCGSSAVKIRRERCSRCYRRLLRVERGLPLRELDPMIRFWSHVEKASGGCWLWSSVIGRDGYAKFSVAGDMVRAHRWSYEHFVGPISKGLVIDHRCRNRSCVNPRHLEPVTHQENVLRGVAPSAITNVTGICQRGHSMTPENTYVRPDGHGVMCRACQNIRQRRRRQKGAAA